ncbi:hypothetical protein BJ508DRAFT_364925 [Ascobolus immersus RN42]|uniref:Uncharacterized protein n=1 Tax=Ascobolus immersus RN42 TaxID=1160509 RepID=A0A3N4HXT5_ASCIM|nr:hypothetical protein BJ508DRAFT_364925 [Ascobolus immersus RN42]
MTQASHEDATLIAHLGRPAQQTEPPQATSEASVAIPSPSIPKQPPPSPTQETHSQNPEPTDKRKEAMLDMEAIRICRETPHANKIIRDALDVFLRGMLGQYFNVPDPNDPDWTLEGELPCSYSDITDEMVEEDSALAEAHPEKLPWTDLDWISAPKPDSWRYLNNPEIIELFLEDPKKYPAHYRLIMACRSVQIEPSLWSCVVKMKGKDEEVGLCYTGGLEKMAPLYRMLAIMKKDKPAEARDLRGLEDYFRRILEVLKKRDDGDES